MGVKGLKRFIRSLGLIESSSIEEFAHERIPIDISHYLYTYKAALGEHWLSAIINLIVACKKFNLHGVPVFDGKPPDDKGEEKELRAEKRNKMEVDIFTLRVHLRKYLETDILDPALIKVLEEYEEKTSTINFKHQKTNNIRKIEAFIKRKEKQIVNNTKEDVVILKKLFDLFGVPWIQAPGEAEALTAYLIILMSLLMEPTFSFLIFKQVAENVKLLDINGSYKS
jgi:5'-3' exonuclease